MIKNNQSLRWRFDVNTFRLLGRELITDRMTAVFELVKNSYDANSTKVNVIFFNVSSQASDRQIVIEDDGIGMSFEDVRDKWMVVGTNSKRTNTFSDQPFNRRFVGEKGIGRFAVDKLGEKIIIKTKQKGESAWLNVNINWDEYEKKALDSQLTLFTEMENNYWYTEGEIEDHGTTLIISAVSEIWTRYDIDRLYKELTKIVSPFYPLNPPFNIYLSSNEVKGYVDKLVKADAIRYASHQASVDFNLGNRTQQILKFDRANGKIFHEEIPIKSFGPVKIKLYFFDTNAKRAFNRAYKSDDNNRIDGIKIYRNGIVTTPFAEYHSHPDNKRDILGIDKRLWRDIFDKIGSREVIGIVDITKENNPQIIDATNRQDFVDNNEYRELKSFIIDQLNIFSEVKKFERQVNQESIDNALKKAGQDVKYFSKAIEELERKEPNLTTILQPLKVQAAEVSSSITRGISEQKKAQQEHIRKENIYLSLMSLQDYAIRISHAVRTSLGKIKRMAEFFKNNFPNSKYDELFKDYSFMIFEEMHTLNKVIDFMLSYAASNIDFEDFSVKSLIENLLQSSYKQTFLDEKITIIINIKDNLVINANKKFFQDIIQNLVSNSIKALQNRENKIIKCTEYIQDDHFIFDFSDNGPGIPSEEWKKIFEIYYTTTAEQGGAGLGLFIVKTRIEALQGTVEVIESEFFPVGCTIRITLPLKKMNNGIDPN